MEMSGIRRSRAAAAHIEEHQGDEGDAEQDERSAIGGGVGEVLDLVVDGNGEGAGGAGDVAADHEDDTEFTDRVREAESRGGDDGVRGERQEKRGKRGEGTGPEEGG